MDLVKGACEERIYPVGRLDKNSLGLLLRHQRFKRHDAPDAPRRTARRSIRCRSTSRSTRPTWDRIAGASRSRTVRSTPTRSPTSSEDKSEIGIEIHSGRNRIVRRIFESLGYSVRKLDRVYYAGLTKKNLKRGAWRFLTKEEVMRLKSGQYE